MPYFTTNDNVRLFYERRGKKGRTVLFVHGWMDHGASYLEAAKSLQDRAELIAYDQRGHGRSDTPADGYNMVRLASDLRGLIEYLEPENLTLVGYSMGTHVIYEYLRLFGDQSLDRIVLCVMSPSWVNEEQPELAMGGALSGREALRRLALLNQDYRVACQAGYPLYLQSHPANEGVRDFYLRAAELDPGAMVRLAIALYSADYWDVLPTVTRPTLVLTAEHDMFPLAAQREQARRIRGAALSIVPDCGHMMIFERSDAWCGELERFLFS